MIVKSVNEVMTKKPRNYDEATDLVGAKHGVVTGTVYCAGCIVTGTHNVEITGIAGDTVYAMETKTKTALKIPAEHVLRRVTYVREFWSKMVAVTFFVIGLCGVVPMCTPIASEELISRGNLAAIISILGLCVCALVLYYAEDSKNKLCNFNELRIKLEEITTGEDGEVADVTENEETESGEESEEK